MFPSRSIFVDFFDGGGVFVVLVERCLDVEKHGIDLEGLRVLKALASGKNKKDTCED